MSLGILNNISAIYAGNNLNNTQASLQKVLQQLSSGARINSGADDAAGLAIADGLKANEASLTQSVQNASDGVGLLQTADGALSQVTNLLDRAVTLATEAANGTLSTTQVSSANQEYQSIISEIGNIGSTTNFNGNSVFGSTATAFYVGDGTATGSNFYSDVVGTLNATSVGQSAGVAAALGSVAVTNSGTALATLTAGHASDTISGSITLADTTNPTSPVNNTITFAAGTTLTAAAAQITASFGGLYTASYTNGASALTIAKSNGTDVITVAANSLNYFQGPTTYTGSTATATTAALPASTTAATGVGNKASINVVTLQAASDTLSGSLTFSTTGTAVPNKSVTVALASGTTLTSAVQKLNSDNSFTSAGFFASVSGSTLSVTGPASTTATAAQNNLSLSGSSFVDAPAAIAPGVGTDFTANTISTLTAGSAQNVLTAVNGAIANVAYQRGILGADSNELTAASNTAASENVNLTAAESSIRSTNYGQATSDLAKFEVLSQTGISALAQANTVQQEILKLLQ